MLNIESIKKYPKLFMALLAVKATVFVLVAAFILGNFNHVQGNALTLSEFKDSAESFDYPDHEKIQQDGDAISIVVNERTAAALATFNELSEKYSALSAEVETRNAEHNAKKAEIMAQHDDVIKAVGAAKSAHAEIQQTISAMNTPTE